MKVLRISAYTMLFIIFFTFIAGPEICHYINLCALALTITSAAILQTIKNTALYKSWQLIIFNIVLSIGLMVINYGYF